MAGAIPVARRISFEDALRFEKIHEETYKALGFELIPVERGSVTERVGRIKAATLMIGEGI